MREIHTRLAALRHRQKLIAWWRPDAARRCRADLPGAAWPRPLAVAVVAEALGLGDTDPATVLDWYAAIVTDPCPPW